MLTSPDQHYRKPVPLIKLSLNMMFVMNGKNLEL